MNKENIKKLLEKILKDSTDFKVELFPFEETKGFYKNIYKIVCKDKTYVLKKAKEDELSCYSSLNNSSVHLPYFYGSYHFYGKDYFLIKYVDGHNAMKMSRNDLIRILDAIIDIQDLYWNSSLSFGTTKEKMLQSRMNRLNYLPDELKKPYEKYIECFKNIPVTFSHEDLLPFNVLLSDKQVHFIDLEVGGILPYPTMLARLIAHTSSKKDAMFYCAKEDYDFAIEYYYENCAKKHGINKEEYIKTMNLFIFNELIEWIYVYKKYGYKPNDFYNNYYQRAIENLKEI